MVRLGVPTQLQASGWRTSGYCEWVFPSGKWEREFPDRNYFFKVAVNVMVQEAGLVQVMPAAFMYLRL